MTDRLHPESYRQLRDLAKLHGVTRLREALQQIEKELTADFWNEATQKFVREGKK